QWTVTIDRGSSDDLHTGMAVFNGDGLVGRVKQVDLATSVVLLVVDPTVKVGVRLEGTGELGYVTGNGTGPLRLFLLDPNAVLTPGQRFVTAGETGSPFPPGVPVGTVSRVLGLSGGT